MATRTTKKKSSKSKKDTRTCAEVMTPDPVSMIETETISEAASAMREQDIGAVIVLDDTRGQVKGIVTDRDIVIRGLADGADPSKTTLTTVCSEQLETLSPDTALDQAARTMRDKAIRRIPIVEDDKPVGILSLGDLAVELDEKSALADISAAPANT